MYIRLFGAQDEAHNRRNHFLFWSFKLIKKRMKNKLKFES